MQILRLSLGISSQYYSLGSEFRTVSFDCMQRKSIKKKLKILALPKSCGNDLLDQLYNELSQKNYVIQGWPNGFTIRIIIKQFFLIFLFRPNFVHIHWPEHFFCTSDPIKFAFQKAQFKILKYMGARIIWTCIS